MGGTFSPTGSIFDHHMQIFSLFILCQPPVASLVEKLGLQKYKSKYKKLGATAEGGFDPDNGATAEN